MSSPLVTVIIPTHNRPQRDYSLFEAASDFQFAKDWFTHNIPLFEQFLGPLKGKNCRILEVGAYEGRSTCWMVEHIVTHDEAHIDTIDVREHPSLRRNLDATGHPEKVTIHLDTSAAILRGLPFDSYDFAYIDGCHWTVETLEDAVLAFRLLKSGGIMAFDDYLWDISAEHQEGRPKEAIDAFLDVYADKINLLHRGYQVWLRKKRPDEIAYRKRRPLHGQPHWFRHPRKEFIALWRGYFT